MLRGSLCLFGTEVRKESEETIFLIAILLTHLYGKKAFKAFRKVSNRVGIYLIATIACHGDLVNLLC